MLDLPTEADPVRIIEGDALEWLPRLPAGCVDAVVTDPPYGIGLECEDEASGGIGRQTFRKIIGDDEIFDPLPWIQFPDAMMFGCNNYCHAIPPLQGQWYFWDKTLQNNGCRIAEGEFIWHKRGTKPRAFRHLWSGAYRHSEAGIKSVHPTQKPVALMRWCIKRLKLKPGSLIIDPYAGSGTTAVACIAEGVRCILIERDPQYVAIARRRVAEAMGTAPGQLFGAATMPQADLFGGAK